MPLYSVLVSPTEGGKEKKKRKIRRKNKLARVSPRKKNK